MVVPEYSVGIFKSVSIGAVIRNPEILNFVPDFL